MVELFANSGDPDQTPRSMASDLGLHCLPITLKVVYRLQWIKSSDENYRHFFLFFTESVSFENTKIYYMLAVSIYNQQVKA